MRHGIQGTIFSAGWTHRGARSLDVDLESSALMNALPVHRMGLGIEPAADAPAAYVRALDLSVDRLEQD